MSHYKTFHSWLFNGKQDSSIPSGEDIPDILKYNSPITHTYVISMFMTHGKLNRYLNEVMNNINLRYIDKEELFRFMKKCVIDFKLRKKDVVYIPWRKRDEVFEKLRKKLPLLKNNDINLLSRLIEKSDDKEAIYTSLNIKPTKKQKIRGKTKQKKKVSLKEFLAENFATIDV